jgi:MFS family permease
VHFFVHLYELSFPAIALTVREDLGWSLGEVLRVSFGMYLLFGLGALPMGLVTDRWRARWMLVLCLLGAGTGAILAAVSQNRVQLVAALALTGLASSIYHPAGMALLSRAVRERGRALGLNGVFGNLGSATAPFLGGIFAAQWGWRGAFAVLGAAGVACGIASAFLRIDEQPRAAVQSEARGRVPSRLGAFALLCLAMLLAGFAYRGMSLVVPALFHEQTTFFAAWIERSGLASWSGVRNMAATSLASFAYAVGVFGQLAGGHLADRHDLRKLYLAFHAASLPFLAGAAVAREAWLAVALSGYLFFSLGMQPIENSLVARLTPERWRSTSYGVKFILNFGVGSSAVYAITALGREGSFRSALGVLALIVVALCVAAGGLLVATRGTRIANADPAARAAA